MRVELSLANAHYLASPRVLVGRWSSSFSNDNRQDLAHCHQCCSSFGVVQCLDDSSDRATDLGNSQRRYLWIALIPRNKVCPLLVVCGITELDCRIHAVKGISSSAVWACPFWGRSYSDSGPFLYQQVTSIHRAVLEPWRHSPILVLSL